MIYINENFANCEKDGIIVVFVDGQQTTFEVEDYTIIGELNETDCEDDNDIARWLVRALLEIRKAERADSNMHCDWSAEDKYTFNVSVVRNDNT